MFEPTESLTRGQRAVEASRFDEARLAYAKALEYEPESIDALRGLGFSLLQLGQLSGSLDALERALRLDPTDLLSCLLMGRLCLRLQQPQGAEVYFRAILERIPASEAARSGLIDALVAQDNLPAAREQSGEMLEASPDSEVANLAAARLAGFEGDDARALQHFETLVRLRPGNPVHLYNRGLCLLRMGRFDEGWRDYEFRFAAGAVNLRLPSTPRWDGRRVSRLLVIAEQGLGDSILFSRFVADAACRVDRLTLACPDSLAGLLGRSLGCPCVSGRPETWPEHDAYLPLMSLPHALGLGAAAAAPRPAYLKVDQALQGRWSAALGPRADGQTRIGVVHATSVAHSTEGNALTRRSCRAADLLPIVRLPGVEAYNLNLGKAAEEAREELPGLRPLPASIRDFDDTAAVIGLLDAVVSVDTACAHVAGAVGVPLLLLLPQVSDWKWRSGEGHAPWYKSVRPTPRSSDGQCSNLADLLKSAL